MRLLFLSLALCCAACGTTAAGGDGAQGNGARDDGTPGADARSAVTAAESGRDESLASLLRRRYPSLRVEESTAGVVLQIRQYDYAPIVVIDGTRYARGSASALAGLRASEITDVKVLKTMAETMVYGADAALGGVIEITTTLGRSGR